MDPLQPRQAQPSAIERQILDETDPVRVKQIALSLAKSAEAQRHVSATDIKWAFRGGLACALGVSAAITGNWLTGGVLIIAGLAMLQPRQAASGEKFWNA